MTLGVLVPLVTGALSGADSRGQNRLQTECGSESRKRQDRLRFRGTLSGRDLRERSRSSSLVNSRTWGVCGSSFPDRCRIRSPLRRLPVSRSLTGSRHTPTRRSGQPRDRRGTPSSSADENPRLHPSDHPGHRPGKLRVGTKVVTLDVYGEGGNISLSRPPEVSTGSTAGRDEEERRPLG